MKPMKSVIEHLITETKRHGSTETPWGAIKDLIPGVGTLAEGEQWPAAQAYFTAAGLQSAINKGASSDTVILRPIGR